MDTISDRAETVNNDLSHKSIRRFRKPLRIIAFLIAASVLVFLWIMHLSQPCDRTNAAYSNFVIEEDAGSHDIAEALEEEGFVRSASGFEMLSKITFQTDFRPGTYYLSPSMSTVNIIHTLCSGLTTSEGFTIPAGYTVKQIASALDRDGIADKDEFLKACSAPELKEIDVISSGSKGLKGSDLVEGFLLPSDYTLSTDADESMMVIMMIDAFSNFYNDEYRARTEELGTDIRDVLVIASIIEKETSVDSERAAISAVLHNRYNLEMIPDEEIYDVPLCCPGEESIKAALYPEENEYTYYVLSSKLDGTHVFTDSEEEYDSLVKEYKDAVAARNAARGAASDSSSDSSSEDESSEKGGEE